jgi:hypothetical protein
MRFAFKTTPQYTGWGDMLAGLAGRRRHRGVRIWLDL